MSEPTNFGQNPGQNSSQNSGLDELVQRIRAFSEPLTDARPAEIRSDSRPEQRPDLRPAYRGAPLPIGPASNGARFQAYEDVRLSPAPVQPASVPQQPTAKYTNGSYRSQYPNPDQAPPHPNQGYYQAPSQPGPSNGIPEPYTGYSQPGNGNAANGRSNFQAQPSTMNPTTQANNQPATPDYSPQTAVYPPANPQAYSQEHGVFGPSERPVADRFQSGDYGTEPLGQADPFAADPRSYSPSAHRPAAQTTFSSTQVHTYAGEYPSNPAVNTGTSAALPATDSASAATQPVLPLDPNSPFAGFQRAINAVKSTLPLVQRLLPLLDGNLTTAINALVAQQPAHTPTPAQQQVRVDLGPVERGLTEVRNNQRELRTQVLEQITTFKRVEDQLERVREATDRNTLEQQELVEDIRSVTTRVSTFAIIGVVLLVLLLGINIFFLVQLQHILR